MAITISDKNRREMSPERDFPTGTTVRQRYCILSSPRSGSTLLGRMLHATGMAGDPQEYFNPPLLQYERERTGRPELTLNEFLRSMEARRTSPNGVFGMKLHYSQMLGTFRQKTPNKNMLALLGQFNQLVWIRRRDRMAQGISQAIGMHTQVWSSEDSKHGKQQDVSIHPYHCVRAMQMVCGDDFGWEALIKASRLAVHEVWYEDLVADYDNQCRAVLEYLGLNMVVTRIPAPPIERQASELNERVRKELIDYMGAREAL